jgi:hypothetical protein
LRAKIYRRGAEDAEKIKCESLKAEITENGRQCSQRAAENVCGEGVDFPAPSIENVSELADLRERQ